MFSPSINAAKAIHKLAIKRAATPLLAVLKSDREAAMREESLKALVSLQVPESEQAIRYALADREKTVRVAGLDLLPKMSIPQEVMVSLLTEVIASKTMESDPLLELRSTNINRFIPYLKFVRNRIDPYFARRFMFNTN